MNQTTKRDVKKVCLCLECGEKITPFGKMTLSKFLQNAVFIVGIGVGLIFNLFVGLILVSFAVISITLKEDGGKRYCFSCKSKNRLPSKSALTAN